MEEGSRLRQIANLSIVSGEKQFKRLSILFEVNRYYAYSYISKNELEKARLYLDKCEEEFPYLDQTNMPLHYELKAFYYWKLKEYDLAYKNINKAIEEVGSVALTSKELNYFVMKADILKEWGKKDEAYDLFKVIYTLNDSISRNDIKSQMIAIESIQKVSTLESELQLQVAKVYYFRVILAAGTLSIILILIILFVIWRSNRKLRERNKELYKGHKKAQEIYKELDKLRIENNFLKEKPDPQQLIIHKLDTYMRKSQAFLDPNITRDQIAIALGTNRQYLLEAIREIKNQAVSEYICSLRLEYTYNQIVNNRDISISEVFAQSGFTNRSYFNREFKREFGMPPSELQSIANEEEELN